MKTVPQTHSPAPTCPLEIELKLALPPAQQSAFLALMARRRSQPVKRKLITRYFDTPDCALSSRGFALRLRKSGRRWVQTLKTEGTRQGGLSHRIEYEMAVLGGNLDWSRFPEMAQDWVPESVRAQLLPVFETQFTRTAWQLRGAGGARIEVALDVGEVRTGTRCQPICEIELELQAGNPDALFALAQGWALKLDCLPLDASKAERGMRLALRQPDRPVRFVPPSLNPDIPVEQAFVAIALACLTQFQANLPGLLTGRDREFLHQSRVALRRLRVALRLFRKRCDPPDALLDDLRALDAALGPARDWDVLCDETLPAIEPHFGDEREWQAGRKMLEEKRAAAHAAMRDTVGELRPGAWLLAFNRWLWQFGRPAQAIHSPLSDPQSTRPRLKAWARRKLKRNHQRLIRDAPEKMSGPPARQHALRVEIKRQRYAMDFFRSLFDRAEQKSYLSALQALQAGLGELNDARMGARRVAESLGEGDAMRHFVLEWLAARERGDAQREMAKQLRKFIKTPPCW
ncbi:MAG: CHAD domain-containing protein [Thiobacillus sp.]|nr:CHAD domain-containing protein [Thiobacillus sp.]